MDDGPSDRAPLLIDNASLDAPGFIRRRGAYRGRRPGLIYLGLARVALDGQRAGMLPSSPSP